MSVLDVIKQRRSRPKLSGAAPSREIIETLVEAGVAAPDHGRLSPWRFIEVRDEARVKLGEIFLKAEREENPDLDAAREKKILSMPMRAPLILIAAAEVTLGHKVPVIEQVVSVAAAVQNMLLVAEELGLGAMWRTGNMAYMKGVKQSFNLKPEDEIVGYLYLGEVQIEPRPREALVAADFLRQL